MKYSVPVIVSVACAAVQALPIPDDRGTNDAGPLADQVAARSKRSFLDDTSQAKTGDADLHTGFTSAVDLKATLNFDVDGVSDIKDIISLGVGGKAKRFSKDKAEEAIDCGGNGDTLDDPESIPNNSVESSGDTVNNADNADTAVSDGFDNSGLIDDSSLTANDIENGVSAEAGDQTGLSKRTIAASVGDVITVKRTDDVSTAASWTLT